MAVECNTCPYNEADKARVSRQIDDEESKLEAINCNIERLEAAKTMIKSLKDRAEESYHNTQLDCILPDAEWHGKNFNDFSEKISNDIHNCYAKEYYDGVDDVLDAICDEITDLKNQKDEKNGFIGWLRSKLNTIVNELEKAFN